jgi:hypothetical protein
MTRSFALLSRSSHSCRHKNKQFDFCLSQRSQRERYASHQRQPAVVPSWSRGACFNETLHHGRLCGSRFSRHRHASRLREWRSVVELRPRSLDAAKRYGAGVERSTKACSHELLSSASSSGGPKPPVPTLMTKTSAASAPRTHALGLAGSTVK